MTAERALKIDWTACRGRGLCADLLPELLEPDPWGYPQTRTDATPVPTPAAAGTDQGGAVRRPPPGTLTMVPDHLEPHARRAVHLCPKLALQLGDWSP